MISHWKKVTTEEKQGEEGGEEICEIETKSIAAKYGSWRGCGSCVGAGRVWRWNGSIVDGIVVKVKIWIIVIGMNIVHGRVGGRNLVVGQRRRKCGRKWKWSSWSWGRSAID